jgi:predicted CXXCH cytochrome family protein
MSMRALPRSVFLSGLLLCVGLLTSPLSVGADEPACLKCHEDVKVNSPPHAEKTCVDCHTNITPDHKGALPDDQKLTGDQICAGCHGMAAK